MKHTTWKSTAMLLYFSFIACNEVLSPNEEMFTLLKNINESENVVPNSFAPAARLAQVDSILKSEPNDREKNAMLFVKSMTLLQLGDEQQTIDILEGLAQKLKNEGKTANPTVLKNLALAWLRQGERENCIYDHSGESCLFPIAGRGIHHNQMVHSMLSPSTSNC